MLSIYFHLTSPEFVGSVSMETIQEGDNVKSTHPHVHSPSSRCLRGAVLPSGSDQLSENRKEQYLKHAQPKSGTEKQRTLFLSQNAWWLLKLTHIHTQPGSSMVIIVYGHQEWRLLASIQKAEMLQPIHVFWGFFCKREDRSFAFEIKLGSLPFKLLPIPQWKISPQQCKRILTHTKSRKTSSLTVFSCSLINKETEHTETKKLWDGKGGVILPTDLAPIMMAHRQLIPGQSSLTKQACVCMYAKADKRCTAAVSPPRLAHTEG